MQRTANWVSDQDHPGPFGGRNLRSDNESGQVPNGTRFRWEGGPIETLMRYREVNLTTEKGREERCPTWLLKRAYLLRCRTAEISTLLLHLSVDVSRPTVPYV